MDLFEDTPPPLQDFRACPCGQNSWTLVAGTGPHAAALRCSECGRFGRWLSKVEVETMRGVS